ncbi:MAG: hypothetical protein ACLSH6_05385 [Limosilactobacillus pontis]
MPEVKSLPTVSNVSKVSTDGNHAWHQQNQPTEDRNQGLPEFAAQCRRAK